MKYKSNLFLMYNEDYNELLQVSCYGDGYFYNTDRNISIEDIQINNFLFFKWFVIQYKKEDNRCETEYLLDEEYINNFIKNAIIEENANNLDISKIIEGKKAIVGNIRYDADEEKQISYISYKLDGKYEEMFVFYSGDLIVIQIGCSDQGPKFIAYR